MCSLTLKVTNCPLNGGYQRCSRSIPRRPFIGKAGRIDSAAEQHDIKLRAYMEIDALPMAVAILASLPVCAVLPASAVEREIAGGRHHLIFVAPERLLTPRFLELAARLKKWKQPKPRYVKGVLAKYAKQVSSASLGAVTD